MPQQEPFCLSVQNTLQLLQLVGRGDVVVVVEVDQCEVFFECRLLEVVLHGREAAQHTPTGGGGTAYPHRWRQHSIPPQVEADVLQEWRDSTNT